MRKSPLVRPSGSSTGGRYRSLRGRLAGSTVSAEPGSEALSSRLDSKAEHDDVWASTVKTMTAHMTADAPTFIDVLTIPRKRRRCSGGSPAEGLLRAAVKHCNILSYSTSTRGWRVGMSSPGIALVREGRSIDHVETTYN